MQIQHGDFIWNNGLWSCYLLHQIVVPFSLNLKMRQCAKFHRFDQVVIDIGVNARLTKSIEGRSCASTPNEPRLDVLFRRVMETARLPHIIAMAADEVRPAIAVRLRVNNQRTVSPTFAWRAFLPVRAPTLPSKTTCEGTSLRMSSIVWGKKALASVELSK